MIFAASLDVSSAVLFLVSRVAHVFFLSFWFFLLCFLNVRSTFVLMFSFFRWNKLVRVQLTQKMDQHPESSVKAPVQITSNTNLR